MIMRRLVLSVLTSLVAATLASADQQGAGQRAAAQPAHDGQRGGPPGAAGGMQRMKWWQDEKVIAELRLAPEQSARIEEIWQTAATRMNPVVEDLRKREELLELNLRQRRN